MRKYILNRRSNMEHNKYSIIITALLATIFTILFIVYSSPQPKVETIEVGDVEVEVIEVEAVETETCEVEHNNIQLSNKIQYTSLDVPYIDSSFKTWMNYKAVTNTRSDQYKFINTYGFADSEGFMRCAKDEDFGIEQDYYLIALGSYYGTIIGTKYRITLDTGNVFYGVLGDCKADKHTNSTNQYIPSNGNIVEFIVDTSILNSKVKRLGSANCYEPLSGKVVKIEKINFIIE